MTLRGIADPTVLRAARRIIAMVNSPLWKALRDSGRDWGTEPEDTETRATEELRALAPVLAYAIRDAAAEADPVVEPLKGESPSSVAENTTKKLVKVRAALCKLGEDSRSWYEEHYDELAVHSDERVALVAAALDELEAP